MLYVYIKFINGTLTFLLSTLTRNFVTTILFLLYELIFFYVRELFINCLIESASFMEKSTHSQYFDILNSSDLNLYPTSGITSLAIP